MIFCQIIKNLLLYIR